MKCKLKIFSMLIIVISIMCISSTVFADKDLSDITFTGGASDFFDSLKIDGYQINDCTKEMRGKGWAVKDNTIFLNNYNSSGIYIRAYEDKISQIQVAVTTDSKIRDGLYGINCNVGLLLKGQGTNSLDIEAGSCGINCSGLLGFYNGRFNIKCIDNGKAIAGINQAHFKIEHCTIAKNATVVVDWKATSWNDFYGIKGISIISGSDDGIGKLSVATENKGKGNAYANDMSEGAIKILKANATVYPGDEQHFFVNMVGIDRLDLTVVEPEIGKTPSKAVSVEQSGVGVEIAGWMEKGKGTYLKDTETYKASTEYIPQFLVKLSDFCEYYPDVEVTVNGKTATFNKMQANNNKVISDISFTTGKSITETSKHKITLLIYEEKEYNDYNFGGAVAVTYGSTSDNTEDCYNYNIEDGVSVTFKATPKDGYEFLRWEKGGNTLTTNTTCTFTAKADETYMAVFEKVATATEQPTQTEQPTKTEEPVKTDEPTTEKTWTKSSEWAEEELDKANKMEIIPNKLKYADLTVNITRAEFAHVAVKLYEKLTGNKAIAVPNNPFIDTADEEVLKAYNLEITKGTSEVTFNPDDLITREQMATMMTRALTKAGIDTKVDLEKVTKFADDGEMHDWGKASIYYMSSIEIIKGVGNNTFNVLGNATREQALLISERSAEKFAK